LYLSPPSIAVHGALAPTVSDFAFLGEGGRECRSISPGATSGAFTFRTNVEGSYHIVCDLDADTQYELVSGGDLLLVGTATPGLNSVPWNGLDNAGRPVSDGTYHCTARVNVGEVHFIVSDVETSFEGLRMYQVNRAGSRAPLSMFWNDSLVQAAEVVMPWPALRPGAETSGEAGMSSGPYADALQPDVTTRAWGNFSSSSKGNNALLDTYAWTAASAGVETVFVSEALAGVGCDDGNACTRADTCRAGVCTGADPVLCPASDTCHEASVCDAMTGVCSNAAKADGASCDDGRSCTSGDRCLGGTCAPLADVCACSVDGDCPPVDQCHLQGTCDVGRGVCLESRRPDGTACDDASLCTRDETCQGGVCGSPSLVVACVPLDPCHGVGTCDPLTGACSNPLAPEATLCDDGRACTLGDACRAGVCMPATNSCVCASDSDCIALGPCHLAGICNTATGVCSDPLEADGAACDDANACTTGEACFAGVCSPATALSCTALDECHEAGVCDSATGTCSSPPRLDGSPCTGGRCLAAVCVVGADGGVLDGGRDDGGGVRPDGAVPVEDGGHADGGHADGGSPDGSTMEAPAEGCGCRVAGQPSSRRSATPASVLAFAVLLSLALRRSRR
jgi:hypothetical protein